MLSEGTMAEKVRNPESSGAPLPPPNFEVLPELPRDRWIKLRDAVHFALFGGTIIAETNDGIPRRVPIDRVAAKARRGALLYGRDPQEFDRVIVDFEECLFEGGANGELRFRGRKVEALSDGPGYPMERVPSEYFQCQRGIDLEESCITAFSVYALTAEEFVLLEDALSEQVLTSGQTQYEWTHVEVERETYLIWLDQTYPGVRKPGQLSDEEARRVIEDAAAEGGGYISQEAAIRKVRIEDPTFPRDRARKIAKDITGNEKRGPRGPRTRTPE